MWWPHTMLVLMMMIYVWRALTIDHRHSTGSVYPADLTKIRCRNCMIVLCVPMESKNDASESKYNFNYVLRFESKMCVSVDKYDCWTGLELHITRWWCLARTRAHHAGRWTWCVRLYVWVWAYCEPLKTKKMAQSILWRSREKKQYGKIWSGHFSCCTNWNHVISNLHLVCCILYVSDQTKPMASGWLGCLTHNRWHWQQIAMSCN